MLRVPQLHTRTMTLAGWMAALTGFAAAAGCLADAPPVNKFTTTDALSHETHFPIASGDHAEPDCNRCHGEFDTFQQFSCIGCHEHDQAPTDAHHPGLTDYVYNQTSCLTCHPRGEGVPDVDHGPYYPIGVGTSHEPLRCGSCHGTAGDRGDWTRASCIDCHEHSEAPMATTHTGNTQYQWQTTACLACHRDGAAVSRDDHRRYYPIGPGTEHERTDCAGCHIDPSDRRVVSCVDCHEHRQTASDQEHGGIDGYAWATMACIDCHRDGRAISRDDHLRVFPIATGTAHTDVRCAECHPTAGGAVQCEPCHAHEQASSAGEHRWVGGYVFRSDACLRCHADAQVDRLQSHLPFRVGPWDKHGFEEAECLECHTVVRSDKPFGADFRSFDCTPCHLRAETDGDHSEEPNYRYDSVTCIQSGCHPDGRD